MKKNYLQPQVDITWLSMEAMICQSGQGEDLINDNPVNPWASPIMEFDNSLIF